MSGSGDAGPPAAPTVDQPTPLGSGVEFDIIRGIWQRLGNRGANLGDDCAIVEMDGSRLAVSVDLSVEGTHFRRGWFAPDDLGWRATMAALSDLAAVAASPRGVLVSLGLSAELPGAWASDLMDGVADAAAAVGAAVWGGDVVRSDQLIVDVVVLGSLTGDPVRRSGAAAGDVLAVTGRLGAVHAAISALTEGRTPDDAAWERLVRPHARIEPAQWLRDRGARAMIDLSDGLTADAEHLAAASGLRVTIDRDRIPLHPTALDAGAAAASGEEYELLVALPADVASTLTEQFAAVFDLPLTTIGVFEAGTGVTLRAHGETVVETGRFSHF